jgi:hypothetical protein
MNRPTYRQFVLRDEGGNICLHEEEKILLRLEGVEMVTEMPSPTTGDPGSTFGLGELYVTSLRVIWLGERSLDFDVAYIVLHAITHDPKSSLYCQFDVDESCNDDGDDDEGDDEGPFTECYFVPGLAYSSAEKLKEIFDAFSHAAVLNPDEEEYGDGDGDGGDDGLIFDESEVQIGAQQAATLAHLESVFEVPEQFRQPSDSTSTSGAVQDQDQDQDQDR